jgi:hypothetical protein
MQQRNLVFSIQRLVVGACLVQAAPANQLGTAEAGRMQTLRGTQQPLQQFVLLWSRSTKGL